DACDRVEVLRDENGIMVHSPESMELLLLKGRALLLTGRYSEAQGHMTSVLGMIARARDNDAMASIISANRTLDDLEYEARWMRGRAWLKDGRLYLARRDLAAVPSASGFFAEAELDLAATHFFEKNYSGVREILKPGNSALPSLSPAISNARREEDPAKLLLEMTSDDERKAYDPFGPGQPEVPFDPAASKALVLLANGILADELDKELNSLQKQRLAQARDNSVLRPLYVREILPKTKDDVGRYALRALRHDPTSDEPYLVLAEHFQRQGDKGNPGPLVLRPYAEMWLQRAEQVNPNNPMLWYRRGFYAARDRNFVAAIPHLKRAIELAPDFVDAYVMLGELYYRFVEDLRNNPPSDLPADEVERRREFLLRTAMAYFTNALGIDGDRLDVMLKLGHCYLERVQNSRILADALEDELGINRENLQVRGKLEQLFNSITGDLNKAEELFNITRFAQPRVLDVVRQTVDNVPEVIVAVGSEAAVVDKMTFRVLKSGSTLTLTVTGDPGAYTCICKPLNWDSDRSVQEQMLYLQPGDRVGEPDLPGSNIEGGRYTIYPEQTVVARAGLGYVYYVKDYVAGARLRLRGEEYQPTPDLQKASEELLWVLQYVKGHGKQQFSTHPAYLYAWDRYFELHRQNRREQWIDTFERSIRSDENGRTSVGQGWKANYFRDEAISFRMGDKDKLLTMHTAQKANGTLTSITRGEDYQRFSALQADLVVDPELMRPRRLMDGCSAGLVVWEMAGPAGQLDDTWKSIAMLVISIDADGRVTWQECQGVTGDKNRPSPLGPPQVLTLSGPGKDVKRRVRTLRLERRYEFGRGNDGGRKFSWHLVVDDRMEAAIPLPENHPLNDASTGDGKSFQVGVFLKAAVGESNCEIAWDAIRVITEKNKDWIKEVTGLRRDLGGNR
ncbi:MAG: tetratricopeptide repeat protein, partial [Planctomycetota bacterium]